MESNPLELTPASETERDNTIVPTEAPPAGFDFESPAKPRGYAWLAWLVTVVTIGAMMFPRFLDLGEEEGTPSTVMFEVQAKYFVGLSSYFTQTETMIENEVDEAFDKGGPGQRLIGAVVLGELTGPAKAAKRLDDIDVLAQNGLLTANDDDREVLKTLRRIQDNLIEHKAWNASFSEDDLQSAQRLLPKKLGWVGRLAMSPPGTSDIEQRAKITDAGRKTFFVMFGVFGLAITGLCCGFLLQSVWWIFALLGRLGSGIGPLRGDGGIYAETFAAWMVLFVALNFATMILPLPKWGLIWVLVPQIGSMAALAWPLIRGLKWSDVREDIGLKLGPQPWLAPFVGLGAYLSALPLVGVAMIVTLVMMKVASQFAGPGEGTGGPMHPIVEPLLRGNWTVRLQLLLVAVFAAVPEEIFFRGFLYRHLRELGIKAGYVLGVAFACIFSSFVFAAIHPQGVFGIPILMTLAMVFALTREWRGSIVPSMIAHALVNAGTTTILFLIAD